MCSLSSLPCVIFTDIGCYYLQSTAEGCGWEIIKPLPYMRLCVGSSLFYINLNISFNYKDSFTTFAYGHENLSVQNYILIKKMAAKANCLKIIMVL